MYFFFNRSFHGIKNKVGAAIIEHSSTTTVSQIPVLFLQCIFDFDV